MDDTHVNPHICASSTPMLGAVVGAVGAVGASSTPMMEVATKQSTGHNRADSLSFGRSFSCRTRGVDIFFAQDTPDNFFGS